MTIKHLLSIFIFWTLFSNINIHAQESAELQKLRKIVFDRIKQDLKDQDASYSLFPLKIDNVLKNPNSNMTLIDSTNFIYTSNSYLRFYLVCSGDAGNIARLRLYKKTGLKSIPDKLLKEITCSSTDGKISTFDYYLENVEKFIVQLTLDKTIPASAFVFGTNYKPKSTK